LCHILIYSEILFGWQLFHKRLELLKSANYKALQILPYQGSEAQQHHLSETNSKLNIFYILMNLQVLCHDVLDAVMK